MSIGADWEPGLCLLNAQKEIHSPPSFIFALPVSLSCWAQYCFVLPFSEVVFGLSFRNFRKHLRMVGSRRVKAQSK